MEIKVLGPGCVNCKTLFKRTERALKNVDQSIKLTKVEDITEILNYNIPKTPALVIDENVVVSGRVPKENEIIEIIEKHINK
jgi:small redox-active disulfide protein 2